MNSQEAAEQGAVRNAGPFVGQLASFGYGADSTGYTVIAVSKSGHKVTLQRRGKKPTKDCNHYGNQSFLTWENPEGVTETFTRRKDGRYRAVGSSCRGAPSVSFGHATFYTDPHF